MSLPANAALSAAERTITLILSREGATLTALRDQLIELRLVVSQLSTTGCWPDDFGAEDTTDVGDDLDDLTDLVRDLSAAIHLAPIDEAGSLSWLRFTADTHWGYHVDDLIRHLDFMVPADPDTGQN